MKPVNHHPESWREALKIISRCPICSENYHTDEAKLFAKSELADFMHITCHNCQSSFVAMIVMLGQGLSSVGMVTDLNFSDLKRLHRAPPLTVDEIIDGYEQITREDFLHQTMNI